MSFRTTRILAAIALGSASFALAEPDLPAPVFSALARKEIKLNDHTVTYVRVRPPLNLPKPPPAPPTRELSSEERSRLDALEAKVYVILDVSATVYLTSPVVTEIKLRTEKREYICYSNADFRNLTQICQFEGENAVYSWVPFIFEVSAGEGQMPAGLSLSTTESEYVVQATEAEMLEGEDAFRGLDLIHAFYEVNKAKLQTDRLAREAEQLVRERELLEHPPKKDNTVIYFWKKEAAR